MLDYFNTVHEKQPHRSHFVGVLSNYDTSWVYVDLFDKKGLKIEDYPCSSLADAIIFAETSSDSQMKSMIPSLDPALDPKFSVIAVGKHYFLLSVENRVVLLPADTRTFIHSSNCQELEHLQMVSSGSTQGTGTTRKESICAEDYA
jgi:hypothetical protein